MQPALSNRRQEIYETICEVLRCHTMAANMDIEFAAMQIINDLESSQLIKLP
jgi:hypothetical protein